MKTYAHITSGVVDEVITLDAGITPGVDLYTPAYAHDMVDVSAVTPRPATGWLYDGSAFSPPAAPPVPPPSSVSRRQFWQMAAIDGIVTEAEAEAALDNVIPAAVAAAIETLPAADQFAARMLVKGAQNYERTNAVLTALVTAMGKTPDERDAFFIAAAAL